MRGRQPAPNRWAGGLSAGPLTDVSEVFALVRSLGGGLDVLQLRRDLIDLFRLVLELVEGDLETQVFREDVQDGLRALRIDEVTRRLPHQAHRLYDMQAAESEQQTARADNAGTGFPAGEHDTVLLHLLHEIRARRGPEDLRLRHHAAHAVPSEGEDPAHAELFQLPKDEVAQLVLALRGEALVVAGQEDEVPPRSPLHEMHLVVHELHLPIVLDEDLGREVLREDLRELDRLQLVLQVFRGELADVPDAREAFDEDRVVQLRMVRISDGDVVHGVSPLQFMDPLKFAPVRPIAVLGRIPRRHRAPRRTTAVRADVLQGVTAARGALLEDRAHRLSPSGGISLRRLSRSRL